MSSFLSKVWDWMKKNSHFIIAISILLLVPVVMYTLWYFIDTKIVFDENTKNELEMQGSFGDQFGMINALFSGLAFSGIIFTLLLQRKDLKETKESMAHERFSNTFFQLLNLHIEITKNLSFRSHSGTSSIEAFLEQMKNNSTDFHLFCALQKIDRENVRKIKTEKKIPDDIIPNLSNADISNIEAALLENIDGFENYLDTDKKMHKDKIDKAYSNTVAECIDNFSHYLRNLYHMLKFVDETNLIKDHEKETYVKFIRSQLSDKELIFIFYNCLMKYNVKNMPETELGYPKMRDLVNKYRLLHNMNKINIIHGIHSQIFDGV